MKGEETPEVKTRAQQELGKAAKAVQALKNFWDREEGFIKSTNEKTTVNKLLPKHKVRKHFNTTYEPYFIYMEFLYIPRRKRNVQKL